MTTRTAKAETLALLKSDILAGGDAAFMARMALADMAEERGWCGAEVLAAIRTQAGSLVGAGDKVRYVVPGGPGRRKAEFRLRTTK